MRAAVNDRAHDVFSSHLHLPLTGELHPLRREFERLLATGNAIALTFAMLACSIIYFWPRSEGIPVDPRVLVRDGVVISPRPVAPGRNDIGVEATAPVVGKVNYEPAEEVALPVDEPSPSGSGESGESGRGWEGPQAGGEWGEFDSSLVPDPPAAQSDYVWWDEPPAMLSIEPPVYPEIVREAGIDGTVQVRVLIGVNGKVKDARVVEGSPALREAALASARTAVFSPALQGIHPVEVWVVIPITFELHERH
jgi:TonB family protein